MRYPYLTVSNCRTVLAAAAHSRAEGLTYQDIAEVTGLSYIQAVHHVLLMSTGRRGKAPLNLLCRSGEGQGRHIRVKLTDNGYAFSRTFIHGGSHELNADEAAARIRYSTLPGFEAALLRMPEISLGSYAAFLHIGIRQAEFGMRGTPAKIVADELRISNFSRHLAFLCAQTDRRGALIELHDHREDRRMKVPALTEFGHTVLNEISAAVLDEEVRYSKFVGHDTAGRLPDDADPSMLRDTDFHLTKPPEVSSVPKRNERRHGD